MNVAMAFLAGVAAGNLVTLLAAGMFMARRAARQAFLRDRLGPPVG